MQAQKSYGPLIRFCLSPLIFTMDRAFEGIVAGIGVLILYPFITLTIDILKKHIYITDSVYISSFVGAFCGTLYIITIGMIDWRLYEQLDFTFPASIISSSMIIGWLEDSEQNQIKSPFIEAFISALLIIIFACIRNYIFQGVLDLRFGNFGSIYNFEDSVLTEEIEQVFIPYKNIWLSPIELRGLMFFTIAFFIAIMGTKKTKDTL